MTQTATYKKGRKIKKKTTINFSELRQNNFDDSPAIAVFQEDRNILSVPKQMLKVKEFYIPRVICCLIQELFYLKHH